MFYQIYRLFIGYGCLFVFFCLMVILGCLGIASVIYAVWG